MEEKTPASYLQEKIAVSVNELRNDGKRHMDEIGGVLNELKMALMKEKERIVEQGECMDFGKIRRIMKMGLQKESEESKRFNKQISGCQKVISSGMINHVEAIYSDKKWEDKDDLILDSISMHLHHDGLLDVADSFHSELNQERKLLLNHELLEVNSIVEEIRMKELGRALNWCDVHNETEDIKFKLCKMRFVQLILAGNSADACKYARDFISPFGISNPTYLSEIQFIMGALCFATDLQKSPYQKLLTDDHWNDIANYFHKRACKILKIPIRSPLSVATSAGTLSLPLLLKQQNIVQHANLSSSKHVMDEKELSVEVDLGEDYLFHSIFSCPVSKEIATAENPPLLLPCGHILCKNTVNRLPDRTRNRKIKCPYCPQEFTRGNCREVYF